MAETEWNIAKPSLQCCACQNGFAPEAPYFSALFQNAEGLSRKDYCCNCFQAQRPADVYYFWKTQVPAKDPEARKAWKQRPVIDIDFVFEFFKRLEGEKDPQKLAFRFILALMLTRKKILVGEGRTALGEGVSAQVFSEKRGGQKHTVVEPALNEEELSSVSTELGVLLGLTPPPARTSAPGDGADADTDAAAESVVTSSEPGKGAKGAAE